MFHERMLLNSPYVTMPTESQLHGGRGTSAIEIARAAGRIDDPVARDLVGEDRMPQTVVAALGRRVGQGIMSGKMSDQSSAVRSEEHTSELQSLMRNAYDVFCLNKKKQTRKK